MSADQPFDDAPEAEFVDLTAVGLVVETTLYDEECDEITPIEIVAGAQPFILLNMAQKEGENTLAYQLLGSMINTEADLLLSIEAFAEALRAKLEQEGATVEGDVVCHCEHPDDECAPECHAVDSLFDGSDMPTDPDEISL